MVNYLKCCKWKVSSILWSNHQHQQRPSEKWGCTRNKGMQIMFSSTPNSAQEEPNSVQIFCFSTLHYSDNREVPCIATVPWFSWVTSFDEWWVTLIQTNQTIECLNCMVNIVIIAHSDKIVCSICFWYDLLVVMNAINKAFGSCWWTFRWSQTPWYKKLCIKSSDNEFGNMHCVKCQSWHQPYSSPEQFRAVLLIRGQMPQTLQVVTTINFWIPPPISGDPQKELKDHIIQSFQSLVHFLLEWSIIHHKNLWFLRMMVL